MAMSRAKKVARIALGAVALGVILLGAAVLVVPRLIDLVALRDRMTSRLSQQLDAEVRCEALRLSWLPTPRLLLDQVSLSMPGTIDVKIALVSVHPRLLPLL